jgi:mevalonate kinase
LTHSDKGLLQSDAAGRLHNHPDTAQSTVTAAACGKTIIVGEHAVVYGARAVAMPLTNMAMGVRLTRTPARTQSGAPVFKAVFGGRNLSDHVMGVIEDAFTVLGIAPFSLEIEGSSTILVGAGLGSSASLCVVVLKAVAKAAGIELSARELARCGNQLERRFHGNPSGLDTAVVAYEEAVSFVKGEAPVPIKVKTPAGARCWHFAIIDSCTRSSTIAMIKLAEPWFRENSAEKIAAFNHASDLVISGLASGDPALVSQGMSASGVLLAQAGVVNDQLAGLIDTAISAGCLAAKTTGAGGGGCVLALLDPKNPDLQLQALQRALGPNRVIPLELP